MTKIKAFKAHRPKVGLEEKIASRPYDVLNSEEAKIEAAGNNYSFLRINKPEIDLPKGTDHYSKEVYNKGYKFFRKLYENTKDIMKEMDD